MFLERIERYAATLPAPAGQEPALADALNRIATDDASRERYLDFARDADQVVVRARMLDLAQTLGWLTPEDKQAEMIRMIGDQLTRDAVSAADVDQVCALNADHAFDEALLSLPPVRGELLPQVAMLACLGNVQAHARVLQALTSTNDADSAIAQVYLQHRPLGDTGELRAITSRVARMTGSDAKVRALQSLARLRLSDRASLDELARLYPVAESPGVQIAIAGVFIRADYTVMAKSGLVQTLRDHRLKSGQGPDAIDVLIRRLEAM
jgi:hypothetical protein